MNNNNSLSSSWTFWGSIFFFIKQDKKIVTRPPRLVIKIKHTRTKYTDSVFSQGKNLVSQMYSRH